MTIALGADTLACHCRLDDGEVTAEDVLAGSAAASRQRPGLTG
jgi:hypothetical protein